MKVIEKHKNSTIKNMKTNIMTMSFRNSNLKLYSLKTPKSPKQQDYRVTSHKMYLVWIVTFSKELQESPKRNKECQVIEDMLQGKVKAQQKNSIRKWKRILKHLKGIIWAMCSTIIPITWMLLIIEHKVKSSNS